MRFTALILILAAGCATTEPRMADSSLIALYSETGGFRYGQPSRFQFTADGKTAFFLRGSARSAVSSLYELDVATGQERELATAATLLDGAAETMTAEERARQDRTRSRTRGISSFQLIDGGARLFVPLSGRFFILDRQTRKVRAQKWRWLAHRSAPLANRDGGGRGAQG